MLQTDHPVGTEDQSLAGDNVDRWSCYDWLERVRELRRDLSLLFTQTRSKITDVWKGPKQFQPYLGSVSSVLQQVFLLVSFFTM